MIRRTLLVVALLALAAACGPAPSEPLPARSSADALRDGDPPPPPSDTTGRGGGGTIGSGT